MYRSTVVGFEMADIAELEVNLLQFVLKSFAYERMYEADGQTFAVFERTETESESKFRPKILKLRVLVPPDWVIYDLAADALRLARGGEIGGPMGTGTASEAAAEKSEFREQGIDWQRREVSGAGLLYAPKEFAEALFAGPGITRLQQELGPGAAL
jgi:hypothetical protein